MNKVKRILAIVFAMAMVMAMNVVAFADPQSTIAIPTATITVKGIADGDDVAVYKLVTLNEAGNEWVYNVDENYFTESNNVISLVEEMKANLKDAVLSDNMAVWSRSDVSGNSVTTEALPVGAYLIKITADDSKIVYGTLVAETYKQDETYLTAENVTVTAKPSNYSITKTISGSTTNAVVSLGETVTFDIDTVFPSFGADTTERVFTITDTPSGMKITGIEVKIAGNTVADGYTLSKSVAELAADESVTLTFDTTDESSYGKTVKVIVTAEITRLSNVNNAASTNHSDNDPKVDLHTAKITLTKRNEDDTETLSGAQFKVYKDRAETPLSFINNGEDVYTLCAAEAEDATQIITAANGSVTIQGLDEGTYHFEEVTAPAGYSINADGVDVIVSLEDSVDETEGVIVKEGTLKDTKLSALPSTGGIGTTIFTVVGCLIMIAAAAMFFVSRRRTEK